MKYIVVDLEMNPVAKEYREEREICRHEIIQIGAVVLDEKHQEIGQYVTLVKPRYNEEIAKNIRKLTGISTEQVQNAPGFEEAISQFLRWCEGFSDEIRFCQWSESDRLQLVNEMKLKGYLLSEAEEKLLADWHDIQQEFDEKLGVENQVSLQKAMMYTGEDFVGRPHDALNDARNTGTLMQILRDPVRCEQALSHVIAAFTPTTISSSLGELFNFNLMLAAN